ncbi:hypothetical protein V2J09_013272 [Rumex salicifolius]
MRGQAMLAKISGSGYYAPGVAAPMMPPMNGMMPSNGNLRADYGKLRPFVQQFVKTEEDEGDWAPREVGGTCVVLRN